MSSVSLSTAGLLKKLTGSHVPNPHKPLFEQEEVKPVLFVTGGGMTPVQASARNVETHGSLLKWVQVTATPGAAPVTSTRELESKCLKKERCALIMKAGPLEVGARGLGAVVDFPCAIALLM